MNIILLHELILSETIIDGINDLLKQLSLRATIKTRKEVLDIMTSSRIYAALNTNGMLVGMATLATTKKLMGNEGHIEDVVVRKTYRGQGIGAALMRKMIEHAQHMKLSSLNLTSNPKREAANSLYKKLGFKQRTTNVYRLALT